MILVGSPDFITEVADDYCRILGVDDVDDAVLAIATYGVNTSPGDFRTYIERRFQECNIYEVLIVDRDFIDYCSPGTLLMMLQRCPIATFIVSATDYRYLDPMQLDNCRNEKLVEKLKTFRLTSYEPSDNTDGLLLYYGD